MAAGVVAGVVVAREEAAGGGKDSVAAVIKGCGVVFDRGFDMVVFDSGLSLNPSRFTTKEKTRFNVSADGTSSSTLVVGSFEGLAIVAVADSKPTGAEIADSSAGCIPPVVVVVGVICC